LEIYNLYGEGSKGVFVLKNGKYFGFINLQNIIKISYEKNLRIANDLNPLTKLPGNKKIDEFIDEVFNKKEKSYMIYFDFNNFKPFNDYYGFRRGDRVIILFSEMLKKVFNDFFVFHIGGDDFFVGCKGAEFEEVLKRVKIIVEKFNKEVVNFYSKEDKKRGFIEIEDRYGIKRRFEFLNLSTLILEISSVSNKENFEDLLGKAKIYSKKFNCFAISIL
jgi:diguanylate cyclase (GGDEF)-like protein